MLKDGVEGLLASPRITLVPWNQIISADYRKLMLGRGRITVRADGTRHMLKFLSNTYRAGDANAVFAHFLGDRFTNG